MEWEILKGQSAHSKLVFQTVSSIAQLRTVCRMIVSILSLHICTLIPPNKTSLLLSLSSSLMPTFFLSNLTGKYVTEILQKTIQSNPLKKDDPCAERAADSGGIIRIPMDYQIAHWLKMKITVRLIYEVLNNSWLAFVSWWLWVIENKTKT